MTGYLRAAFFMGATLSAMLMSVSHVDAGIIYGDPAGGWTYIYQGADAAPGDPDGTQGFNALDGSWSHENGSDEWEGSAIGSGAPGGASILSEDVTSFLRIQETGDPRDHNMPDPSNRKLFFGHDITAEGASDTILDDGVTFSFRARLATAATGPVDDTHPDGGGATSPWPANGDGYLIHDGGKGNFTLKQASGGGIAFSLALPSDHAAVTAPGGLIMNNLNGAAVTGDVDTGEAGDHNQLDLGNLTAWQEIWFNIIGDESGGGTHRVDVFANGATSPQSFHVTAGTGDDFGGISYMAMAVGATPQSGALDIDFFAWSPGALVPTPGNFVLGDVNEDSVVDIDDYVIIRDNFQTGTTKAEGDVTGDGRVSLEDFRIWKREFTAAGGAPANVPEPSAIVLAAIAMFGWLFVRRVGT